MLIDDDTNVTMIVGINANAIDAAVVGVASKE